MSLIPYKKLQFDAISFSFKSDSTCDDLNFINFEFNSFTDSRLLFVSGLEIDAKFIFDWDEDRLTLDTVALLGLYFSVILFLRDIF